ncbi:MAG: guanylate kinase [Gemmatimonadota bacterium]
MTGSAAPAALGAEDSIAPRRRSFPVVLSAPSGTGKTSVGKAILKRFPELAFSVSATTRPPRAGEVEGRDYEFLSEEAFLRGVDGGVFAEWARVHAHYYGTPRDAVERPLGEGRHVLLDVDVQGARSLLSLYPFAVSIFLLPPSRRAMAERLRARGTEDEQALRERLAGALQEVAQAKLYQYVLVNDSLGSTIDLFEHILRAEEQRRSRIANWTPWIEAAFRAAGGGERT